MIIHYLVLFTKKYLYCTVIISVINGFLMWNRMFFGGSKFTPELRRFCELIPVGKRVGKLYVYFPLIFVITVIDITNLRDSLFILPVGKQHHWKNASNGSALNQVISTLEHNNHSTPHHKSPPTKNHVNLPVTPNLLESSFPRHQRTKNQNFFAKRSLQHHAWFTTNECFTFHCPVAASRMLGHWRCRETPRGKWWGRTSGCEPQGSLGAETCLLRGTASRVAEFLLKQQNNSKQTCSYELLNGPDISLW